MAGYDERFFSESRHKDQSYCRIGLYRYSRQDGHENVCDVHITWPAPGRHNQALESRDRKTLTTIPHLGKVWFSGPNDTVRQIRRVERSRREIEEYDWHRDVSPELDVAEGGQGLVVSVGNWPQTLPKPYTYTPKVHVWLFGPLLLDNWHFGSLFFELTGPFRRDMVFRPFVLHGSTYSDGLAGFVHKYRQDPSLDKLTYEQAMDLRDQGKLPGSDYWERLVVDSYASRVKGVVPVPLAAPALRWEWTVEAYARNLTQLQAMKSSG